MSCSTNETMSMDRLVPASATNAVHQGIHIRGDYYWSWIHENGDRRVTRTLWTWERSCRLIPCGHWCRSTGTFRRKVNNDNKGNVAITNNRSKWAFPLLKCLYNIVSKVDFLFIDHDIVSTFSFLVQPNNKFIKSLVLSIK